MSTEPLDRALREIAETKGLLESLINSSESFNYIRAKAVLQELHRKVRALGKLQAELSARRSAPGSSIVRFPGS